MSIMSNLTAAYLAGFVDGEGYISLHRSYHKSGDKKLIYYTPVIKIANTNKQIIEWIKSSFGGWIYVRRFPIEKNYKDAYHWQLTGKPLEPFLFKLFPYLKIKRKQCELVLEKIRLQKRLDLPYKDISQINNQRVIKMDINREYRDGLRKKTEDIYLELRKLNQTGRGVQCERLNEIPSKEDAIV